MTLPLDIHSIGHACQLLQVMPNEIRKQAELLKISPAMTINGIAHFNERDLQRIREHLAARRAKNVR